MPCCRALVFDFDGVIIESEHIKTRAFRELYGEHGPEVVAAAVAHHEANGGISRRKKIRHCHATPRHRTGHCEAGGTVPALLGAGRGRSGRLRLGAGSSEVLATHFGRRPMFVVSGTPQEELTRIIYRRGLARWFTEAHGSPPEKAVTVRSLLARYNLDPRTVLFVGDAAADWRAARETGVRFIGRLADGQPNPFPAGTPLISDLRQLIVYRRARPSSRPRIRGGRGGSYEPAGPLIGLCRICAMPQNIQGFSRVAIPPCHAAQAITNRG